MLWLLGFELRTFGRAVGCSYPLSHLTSPPIFLLGLISKKYMTLMISVHRVSLYAEMEWFYKKKKAIIF